MSTTNTQNFPLFGYELIRDHVLSSVLGKNEEDILYWCGKELARKFPLYSMEEAVSFFQEAGWGELSIEKQSKDETFYTLTGDHEAMQFDKRCFRLESGFLAAQQEKISGFLTECYDEKKAKRGLVRFHVKWDLKDKL
jgi:predicted hydrocarbon binding protein